MDTGIGAHAGAGGVDPAPSNTSGTRVWAASGGGGDPWNDAMRRAAIPGPNNKRQQGIEPDSTQSPRPRRFRLTSPDEDTPEMIVVTGATGNTGSCVLGSLARTIPYSEIVALVRADSDTRNLQRLGVETHVCAFNDPATYLNHVQQGSTFLGISNIRHCDEMLPHLLAAGVSRFYCVSTTAVFSRFHSYSDLYSQMEARLASVDKPMCLLRPSMIYGNERDYNMRKLIGVLSRTPVFPVLGDGTALMQPVHVEDLANGIATAVQRKKTGAYNLAGPESLSYNDILTQIMDALGRRVRLIHINHRFGARLVKRLERLPGFPVSHEQVMRLTEDKSFDITRSVAELGYSPRPFHEGIAQEISLLKSEKSIGAPHT